MDCILLFLKAPEPGKVKTRLAKSIGGEDGFDIAAALYNCFVLDWCDRLHQFCQPPSPGTILRVLYSPPEAKTTVQQWLSVSNWGAGIGEQLYPQAAGDLGDRLHQAFVAAFDAGAHRAIAVGTDSPDLPLENLTQLFGNLDTHHCRLIPSTDGGYCAIGFHRDHYEPAVFQNMAWSTETVFADTLTQLRSHHHTISTLPPWTDVDNLDDLHVLMQQLQNPAIALQLPRTHHWLMANIALIP